MSSTILKDDAEAERILHHPDNVIHRMIGSGNHGAQVQGLRGPKRVLGLEGRSEIASLAKIIGVKNTSEITGLSTGQVSNYKNGYVATGHERQKSEEQIETTEKKVGDTLNPVREKMLEKIMQLVGVITDEKLEKLSIGSATASAERLANVFERIGPKSPMFTADKQQVIFISPPQKPTSEYITLDA